MTILRLLRAAWRHAEGVRPRFVLFVVLSATGHLIALSRPWLLGLAFDEIQVGGSGAFHGMAYYLGLSLLANVLFWIFHKPSRIIERLTAFQVRSHFYRTQYARLTRLPLTWHQNHHSGDTINRVRKAGDALFDYTQGQFMWIEASIDLAGPILMLLVISWPLAAVALIVNLSVVLILRRFDRFILDAMGRENEAEHRFSSALFDYVANMTSILSLRLGQDTAKELSRKHALIRRPFRDHVWGNELKYLSLSASINFMEAGTILFFVHQQLQDGGTVLIGTTVAVYRYLNLMSQTFYNLAWSYGDLMRKGKDLEAISSLESDFDRLVDVSDSAPPPSSSPTWRTLSLSGLNYRYPGRDQEVVDVPRLDIEGGSHLALVGESGAGKSTLLSLIRGLRTSSTLPVNGRSMSLATHGGGALGPQGPAKATLQLRLDGKAAEFEDFVHFVTLVPQDPEVFENTLLFNVTLGMERVEDLERALFLSCFDRVLSRLPEGLDTDIRERGVNLSGGEKQRLALARALFHHRPGGLLLLDEATSSCDPSTARAIFERLFLSPHTGTIVASVHQLGLLELFDEVLVLREGRVVERGRPGALAFVPS